MNATGSVAQWLRFLFSDEVMMRHNLLIFLLYFSIVLAIFAIYLSTQIGDPEFVMPLDDVYIHFQYARQLATGHPYHYNLNDAPTSGATSFIYPFILAIGYVMGFQGFNLGIWAMLIGAGGLLASMWAIYRLVEAFDSPLWLSTMVPILFALTGAVSWHAMSGMETSLMMCFSLWTLLTFLEKRLKTFVIFAILLALTRPEGSIMAGVALVCYMIRLWREKSDPFNARNALILIFPILAIGVQPVANYLMTGSFSASGSQAKSLVGLIPQDWGIIFSRIFENFLRMWWELLTGYSPSQELWYLVVMTVPLGLIGWLILARNSQYRFTAIVILLWVIGVSLAISTLDTAFWHFKRYQMPLMALFVPIASIPLAKLSQRFTFRRSIIFGSLGLIATLFGIMTFQSFFDAYRSNINYVRQQPLAMARWLIENTPQDAIIAVHDVGLMRYVSNRTTLDIVGLTTPDAAPYWRNGVGSVAEFLLKHQPDYIASYGRGHGYGLYMLADTRLYGNPLAEFPVEIDFRTNVALAAEYQAIYQPDWDAMTPSLHENVLAQVNVAELASEASSDYHWSNSTLPTGFATVVYDMDLRGCETSHSQTCKIIDSARNITGEETFTLKLADTIIEHDLLITSRVHALHPISLDIYTGDTLIDTQWIPQDAGYWFEISTRIPQNRISSDIDIRIVPHLDVNEVYMPANHFIQAENSVEALQVEHKAIVSFQDQHIQLTDYGITIEDSQLELTFDWYSDGRASGDYRFFAHLYSDLNVAPIAQWDGYLGNGSLPPGNWLQGTRHDTITLTFDTLPKGTYQLAIGFYDTLTLERLIPSYGESDILADGRYILQNVEIN